MELEAGLVLEMMEEMEVMEEPRDGSGAGVELSLEPPDSWISSAARGLIP